MTTLRVYLLIQRLRRDCRAQDLIEYALMAGFVAVAAGATFPSISGQVSTIYSKINSLLTASASGS